MHILDGMVTEILHQVFSKMREASESEIIQRTQDNLMVDVKEQLASAKREFAKATKEYEDVTAKLMALIRGESSLPESVLTEMAEEAHRKMMRASDEVSAMNAEMHRTEERAESVRREYHAVLKWSEMFDESDMAVRKMVAGYIIKRINVYSEYRIHIEFNINFEQFNLGLEIPNNYDIRDTNP